MVSGSDVKYKKSSSGVGLGGTKSGTVIVSATPTNFFDDVTAAQATSGLTEYRCFFVENGHATESMKDLDIYLQSDNPNSAFSTVQWGFEPYRYSPFATLDGIDDFFEEPNSTELQLTKFTVCAWFKTSTDFAGDAAIISKGGFNSETAGENQNYGIFFRGDDKLYGEFEETDGTNHRISSTSTYNDGKWHFALLQYDGTLLELFIDNMTVSVAFESTTAVPDLSSNPLRIGKNSRADDSYFTGNIDEVRVWNRALTQDERLNLYNWGIVPSNGLVYENKFGDDNFAGEAQTVASETTAPLGVNWLGVTNGPISNTPNIGTLGPNGKHVPIWVKWTYAANSPDAKNDNCVFNVEGKPPSGGTGGSGSPGYNYTPTCTFDGIDDNITQAHSSSLSLTTFTILAWFKTTKNYASSEGMIILKGQGSSTAGNRQNYLMKLNNTPFTNQLEAGFQRSDGTEEKTFTSGVTWNDGQWHLCICTYDGTIIRLYVDGTEVHTRTTSATPGTNTNDLQIGADVNSSEGGIRRLFEGNIDEVRVWNIALTATEVTNYWNGGTVPRQSNIVYENVCGGSGGSGGGVTPPTNTGFSFVAGGDWGCEDMTDQIVDRILALDPDLVLGVGDNNYEDDGSISCWLNAVEPIEDAGIRLETALGNHDNAESAEDSTETALKNHFGYSNTYYSFDMQNVHFLVLDNTTETSFGSGSAQHTFAGNDLANARANPNIDWIVVSVHKPMWGASSDHGYNTGNFNQAYAAMFDTHKVDLIITGHNHNLQITKQTTYNSSSPTSPTVVDSSSPYVGGVGRIHVVSGTFGHDSGSSLYSLGSQPGFQEYQNDNDNAVFYCELSNNNQTMTCSFIEHSGATLHTIVINR